MDLLGVSVSEWLEESRFTANFNQRARVQLVYRRSVAVDAASCPTDDPVMCRAGLAKGVADNLSRTMRRSIKHCQSRGRGAMKIE
jgi:hypothetical protein